MNVFDSATEQSWWNKVQRVLLGFGRHFESLSVAVDLPSLALKHQIALDSLCSELGILEISLDKLLRLSMCILLVFFVGFFSGFGESDPESYGVMNLCIRSFAQGHKVKSTSDPWRSSWWMVGKPLWHRLTPSWWKNEFLASNLRFYCNSQLSIGDQVSSGVVGAVCKFLSRSFLGPIGFLRGC